MVTRFTLDAASWGIDTVECYPDLDSAIKDMATGAWGNPDAHSLEYITDDRTGEVLATAILSPELELFVTCSDGRRLSFPMPESYRN